MIPDKFDDDIESLRASSVHGALERQGGRPARLVRLERVGWPSLDQFLCSTEGRFFDPTCLRHVTPRAAAVKDGPLGPPPEAARSVLDGGEHGVTLARVGTTATLAGARTQRRAERRYLRQGAFVVGFTAGFHARIASRQLLRVLTATVRIDGGFAQPETGRGEAAEPAAAIDQAAVALAEAHHMIAGFELGDANRFADQRLADEDAIALPHDLAGAAHAPDLVIGIIPRLLDAIRHHSPRRHINLMRRPLAERFVRTLLVVVPAEGVEARLLLDRIRSRRARSLRLERAMHALVAAVLLRGGRMDKVRLDTELDPPRRQSREAAGAGRTERRPVVATDRFRQSVAVKRRRKDGLRSFNGRRHDPHLDQIAAMAVSERQRINPAVVAGAEPTLEIGRPLVIGRRDRRHGPPLIERRPAPLDRRDQPGTFENIADRRSRRPAGLGSPTIEHRPQLARPQMREAPAQRNDRFPERR